MTGVHHQESRDTSSHLWLLNLDSELEFLEGPSYSPRKHIVSAMGRIASQVEALVRGEDWVLPTPSLTLRQNGSERARYRGIVPWCPTWQSSRIAKKLGLRELSLSTPETVRKVTSRAFFAEVLHAESPPRRLIRTEQELFDFFGNSPTGELPNTGRFRTKRLFSSQGRGQRVLRTRLIKDDQKFLLDGVKQGGILVEPELDVLAEFSLHGMLLRDGLILGESCVLEVDPHGAPQSIRLAENTPPVLVELAATLSSALREAGYAGPFGIDFLQTETGYFASELNPRFTLGWSVGMSQKRDFALQSYLSECEALANL